MPSHHCRQPRCPVLLPAPGWCPKHADAAQRTAADRQQAYDRHARDPEAKRFYDSPAWKRARDQVLAVFPVCQRCGQVWSRHVHHVKPLADCSPAERVDPRNLLALCVGCHNVAEDEAKRDAAESVDARRPFVAGTLTVREDDRYHFDAAAADRPMRFIEKFCRHYEGRFAGQPFTLLPWQVFIIRTLFGWKHRETGLRRFRELYLISAKGAGKTPLLSAVALYMLLADGEAAPHVVSMASTFEQANLTFSAGKAYVRECPALGEHVEVRQYAVTTHKHGKWTTISGKPSGRSGPRPSCVIADECHEWPGPTAVAFELLTANLFKRAQPLLLVATNAGNSRSSFAFGLHERATKVLTGELADDTLLPVIYEASPDLPWDSEAAAAAANPSLGSVVQWSQLAPQLARARESAAAEAQYRRLYLSQWALGGGAKWLDMRLWDAAAGRGPVDPAAMVKLPLFVGLDLSQGDDLCAAAYVWTSPGLYHVRTRFWVPRVTADKYQVSEGHPYREWEAAGAITLLDETTITPDVQARIAADVVADVAGQLCTAVAYDRYRADAVIAALEKAGLTCIPVAQGYTLSPGCTELERRLTAGGLHVEPNPVMRAHAETVEVQSDARGNYWPRKPGAKAGYKGRRGAKIDGVAALVTAFTEAKRREVTPEPPKWDGKIERF